MAPTAPVSGAASSNTASPGNGTQNPANGTQGQGQQNAAAQQPAKTLQEEIQELISKKGGFDIKAGGKQHKVDSIEKLIRYAQKGIPVEQTLESIQQERAQMAPFLQALKALKDGDDSQAEGILERLLTPERLRRIAETRLRREFQQEEEEQKLTPREREMARQMRQMKEEQARYAELKKSIEQKQEEAVHRQQVEAIKQHMGSNIMEALKQLDLPDKLEPLAVEFMKPVIRSMLSAGMELNPAILADKVAPIFEQLLNYKVRNLEGEKLLKFLGDDVGKKFRKALLDQLNSAGTKNRQQPSGENREGTQPQTSQEKKTPKVDFRKPIF